MSVTPEIKTKFSLQGLRQARTGFGRLSDSAKAALGGVKKSAGDALKPMEKDIARAKRSLGVLKTAAATTGTAGFGALTKSANLSFRAIKIGSIAAAASIAAIGVAATKAAKDSAAELDKIAKDSKRLGVSTEDLSVLGFAAEREGVNPEEVTKGIAKIGSEFLKIRQQIAAANSEFERMHGLAQQDARIALLSRDGDALQGIASGLSAARTGSMDGINARIAQVEQELAGLDVISGRRLSARGQLAQQAAIQARRRELGDLLGFQQDLKKSFGPAGEALFGLEQYGLNVEKTSKGGVEGLLALGDAMRRVEDPSERLRYSILLFGEDAGPKLLNLLMSGREGMRQYREEAERLGIVVSEADAKMAEAYEDAATNFRRSMQGLKMNLGRALLPSLTESTDALTDFVVKHRDRITSLFRAGLEHLKNFALDIWDLLNGQDQNLRTEWLVTLLDRIAWVRESWKIFKEDVVNLSRGGDARWPWLDTLGKGIYRAVMLAQDLARILQGEDAMEFAWLNKLRDDFLAFANEIREWVVWFSERFREAWDLFSSVLAIIRDTLLKPIADLFGMDPTTLALFIGLGKISGLLGIVLVAVKAIGKGLASWAISGIAKAGLTGIAAALGAATGVAVPGAAAAGAVGTAAAAGGMGAGTAAAAGAGAAGAARMGWGARAGALARGVIGRAALPVAMVDLGYQTGKGIGHLAWEYGSAKKSADKFYSEQLERAQAIGERSLRQRHNRLMKSDGDYMRGYWGSKGIVVSDPADALRNDRNMIQSWAGMRSSGYDMSGNAIPAARPRETIEVKLDFNGKQVSGEYAPLDARMLAQEATRMSRMGGR